MNIREFFTRLAHGGRLWLIIPALVLGILLLFFAGKGESKTESGSFDADAYAAALEEDIARLCEGVEGVSHIRVAVSLSGSCERVYATDADGSYVIVGSGSSASGMLLTERMPQINGVGIVCAGGDDPNVRNRLISLVSAAYGVGANRIFVAGSKK